MKINIPVLENGLKCVRMRRDQIAGLGGQQIHNRTFRNFNTFSLVLDFFKK